MAIVVLISDALKVELMSNGIPAPAEVIWVNEVISFQQHRTTDVFIDFLFENTQERIEILKQLQSTVIVNSVVDTLAEIDEGFIRINGWPTFLKGGLIEATCLKDNLKEKAAEAFVYFEKTIEWLPDEPGFVTPRVVSMIINEAYFALGEGVSAPEQIDMAMKLGTAYPYGPFEWANKIGVQNIVDLLNKLSRQQARYIPCELLVQETNKAI